jgi:RNA polymerase sigma-70 factor (ECF subfamily)
MARGIGFRSVTFPEAIRLARILRNLLPAEREVAGLLALLLLVDARRDARTDDAGYLVLLADRDRI